MVTVWGGRGRMQCMIEVVEVQAVTPAFGTVLVRSRLVVVAPNVQPVHTETVGGIVGRYRPTTK